MLGDFDIGEFKKRWTAVITECGLEDNNWVSDMY